MNNVVVWNQTVHEARQRAIQEGGAAVAALNGKNPKVRQAESVRAKPKAP